MATDLLMYATPFSRARASEGSQARYADITAFEYNEIYNRIKEEFNQECSGHEPHFMLRERVPLMLEFHTFEKDKVLGDASQ